MWLMQALGFLLSALQVEEILKNLHSLISPYIQQLEKLAEEIVSELGGGGVCIFLSPGRRRGGTLGLGDRGECMCDCLSSGRSRDGTLGLPFVWAVAAEGWVRAGSQGWGQGAKLGLGDPEHGLLPSVA